MSEPESVFRDADLSILGGHRVLMIEVERNLFGGQPLVRLLSKDPIYPRRKPVNIMRAAGVADVWVAQEGQGAAGLLADVAGVLGAVDPSRGGVPDAVSEVAMRAFIERTQEQLWDQLANDVTESIIDAWSIAAANTCSGIIGAARLVGPTGWESVPATLIAGGVWEALLALGGVPHPALTDDDRVRARALAVRHLDERAATRLFADLRRSVAAMRDDARFILEAT